MGEYWTARDSPWTTPSWRCGQANVHGRYAHVEDTREVPLVEGFDGFGRTIADGEGRFTIVTVKPGCVPGPGDTVQAPHISLPCSPGDC